MFRHDHTRRASGEHSPGVADRHDDWVDLGNGLALALSYDAGLQRWTARFALRGMGVTLMPLEQREPHAVAAALAEALELAALGCPPLVSPFETFDPAQPAVLKPGGDDPYRVWLPCPDCHGCSVDVPTPAPPVGNATVRLLAARVVRALEVRGTCLGCDAARIRSGQAPDYPMIWFDPDGGWELWWPGDPYAPACSVPLGLESLFADPADVRAAAARALDHVRR